MPSARSLTALRVDRAVRGAGSQWTLAAQLLPLGQHRLALSSPHLWPLPVRGPAAEFVEVGGGSRCAESPGQDVKWLSPDV